MKINIEKYQALLGLDVIKRKPTRNGNLYLPGKNINRLLSYISLPYDNEIMNMIYAKNTYKISSKNIFTSAIRYYMNNKKEIEMAYGKYWDIPSKYKSILEEVIEKVSSLKHKDKDYIFLAILFGKSVPTFEKYRNDMFLFSVEFFMKFIRNRREKYKDYREEIKKILYDFNNLIYQTIFDNIDEDDFEYYFTREFIIMQMKEYDKELLYNIFKDIFKDINVEKIN